MLQGKKVPSVKIFIMSVDWPPVFVSLMCINRTKRCLHAILCHVI